MYNYGQWIPGTESIFRYASIFPHGSPGGVGIEADVYVQAFDDHTLRIKFEGSEIGHKVNGTLNLPVGHFILKDFKKYLEETFLVQLKHGNVKSFFVSRKEPNAVTNIKKSFLSQISAYPSETTHTAFRSTPNHRMIEFLRKESITAYTLKNSARNLSLANRCRDYITR